MIIDIDYEELIKFVKEQENILYIPDHISLWLNNKNVSHKMNDVLDIVKKICDLDLDIGEQLHNKFITSNSQLMPYQVHIPVSEIGKFSIEFGYR